MKLVVRKGNPFTTLRMLRYRNRYSSKLSALQQVENTFAKFENRAPEKLIIGKQVVVAN